MAFRIIHKIVIVIFLALMILLTGVYFSISFNRVFSRTTHHKQIEQALPVVIAHHAGQGDWPGNTVFAIKQAEKAGVKIINITLELSKDGVPFAFHGFELSKFTDGQGNPENMTMTELKKLDAGYRFQEKGRFPYRNKGIAIPALKEILEATNLPLILDIKTAKYKELIDSLNEIITCKDWGQRRLIFYSTDSNAIDYLIKKCPDAEVFQKRDNTRYILLNYQLNSKLFLNHKWKWDWVGFESERRFDISETFTLGKATTIITDSHLWKRSLISSILKRHPDCKIIIFNVDTGQEYRDAVLKGVYGVYTDHPLQLLRVKNSLE
ncbi:MAG: hypothetical protein GY750_00050 [Lentisphaerae bacterium]|nr:hypothetical protein [Lentisphaerota bacterium]MCP4099811.1 hypothetical protein [Lentisphaerota bacterium]